MNPFSFNSRCVATNVKVRTVITLIIATAFVYNAPRFFEFEPVYTVTYICPNSTGATEYWMPEAKLDQEAATDQNNNVSL